MADYSSCTIEFPLAALDVPEIDKTFYDFDNSFADAPDITNGLVFVRLDELRWGKPQELEDALVKHKFPYDRVSDATYEYPAERVMHRPGIGWHEIALDINDNPYVNIHQLTALQKYKGEELEEKIKELVESLQPSHFEPLKEMVTSWEGDIPSPQQKLTTENGGTLFLHQYKTSLDLVLPDRVCYQYVGNDGTKGKVYRAKLIWVPIGEGHKAFFYDFMEKQLWLEDFEECSDTSVAIS